MARAAGSGQVAVRQHHRPEEVGQEERLGARARREASAHEVDAAQHESLGRRARPAQLARDGRRGGGDRAELERKAEHPDPPAGIELGRKAIEQSRVERLCEDLELLADRPGRLVDHVVVVRGEGRSPRRVVGLREPGPELGKSREPVGHRDDEVDGDDQIEAVEHVVDARAHGSGDPLRLRASAGQLGHAHGGQHAFDRPARAEAAHLFEHEQPDVTRRVLVAGWRLHVHHDRILRAPQVARGHALPRWAALRAGLEDGHERQPEPLEEGRPTGPRGSYREIPREPSRRSPAPANALELHERLAELGAKLGQLRAPVRSLAFSRGLLGLRAFHALARQRDDEDEHRPDQHHAGEDLGEPPQVGHEEREDPHAHEDERDQDDQRPAHRLTVRRPQAWRLPERPPGRAWTARSRCRARAADRPGRADTRGRMPAQR